MFARGEMLKIAVCFKTFILLSFMMKRPLSASIVAGRFKLCTLSYGGHTRRLCFRRKVGSAAGSPWTMPLPLLAWGIGMGGAAAYKTLFTLDLEQ